MAPHKAQIQTQSYLHRPGGLGWGLHTVNGATFPFFPLPSPSLSPCKIPSRASPKSSSSSMAKGQRDAENPEHTGPGHERSSGTAASRLSLPSRLRACFLATAPGPSRYAAVAIATPWLESVSGAILPRLGGEERGGSSLPSLATGAPNGD